MPGFTIAEKCTSRRSSTGKNAAAEVGYLVYGLGTEADAKIALRSFVPSAYENLFFNSISQFIPIVQDNESLGTVWDAAVTYGTITVAPKQPGDSSYTFGTSGGTQHVTVSKSTRSYPPAGAANQAPDVKGLIGATKDGVEGCDIVVRVYDWEEARVFQDSDITLAYKKTVRDLTGTTNQKPFRGFNPREVLFMGASGTLRGDGLWEITFRFASGTNQKALTVGTITGIEKDAWEYLNVMHRDKADTAAKAMGREVIGVYVHQVYDEGDFSLLGIGE